MTDAAPTQPEPEAPGETPVTDYLRLAHENIQDVLNDGVPDKYRARLTYARDRVRSVQLATPRQDVEALREAGIAFERVAHLARQPDSPARAGTDLTGDIETVRGAFSAPTTTEEQCGCGVEALRELAEAAVAYDDAIRSCANDPEKMASFCSAQGDDLDELYFRWMTLARRALSTHVGGEG